MRAGSKVAAALGALLATVGVTAPAQAATFPVACGNNAAFVTAVNNANLTTAADVIDITGAPCTFSFTTAAATAANNNNTALPLITQPLTIEGNGATIERSTAATQQFRLLLNFGGALTVRNLTVQRGLLGAGNVGAGIAALNAPLTLDRVNLASNSTSGTNAIGGAVWIQNGVLTVDHTQIFFNTAPAGSAIATVLSGTAAARSVVRRSLVWANGGASSPVWVQQGVVDFENDTFAANAANNGLAGIAAGTLAGQATAVTVASSTFGDASLTSNTAPANALWALTGATIGVTDTIVTDTDSAAAAVQPACVGTVTDGGGNLEHPAGACPFGTAANPLVTNALFGANGGPTLTYRLPPGSPAIDLGGATCPATDQRDVARPDGDGCDAGAYEAAIPETTAAFNGDENSPTNNPVITFSSPDTPGATFQCRIDNTGSFTGCTSPYSPALSDGPHVVEVRAVSAGYADPSPAGVTFVVDKTAPVVTITSEPPLVTDDPTATVEFTVSDPAATVTCQVDAQDPVPCASSFTTEELPDGSHTITVRATDEANNAGSDSATFTVDTAPPQSFSVECGDVTALRAAITAANATLAHDTIDVANGPCTFTLTNSVDPAAGGNGLPIVVRPLTLEGHGATIERSAVTGTPNFRILAASATTLVVRDLKFTRGTVASNSGGGILGFLADLTLENVTLTGNVASGNAGHRGGGVATVGGVLHVTRSAFFFNAAGGGGGLSTIATPGSVSRTVFFGNAATASTGAMLQQGGTIDIENTTFSSNSAPNGIGGLAVINNGATEARANVASSSFVDNGRGSDTAPGGALFTLQSAGTVSIHVTDTIVADRDSTATPVLAPCDTSFGGTIVDDGGNLEWPGTTCGFGTNADPKLSGIEAAGSTFVHRPLPGSPAIDLGGAQCPSTDQRGAPRPDGDGCDTGAYETPAPETEVDGPDAPTAAAQFTFSSPDTPDATFECRVDDGAFAPCTSPHSVTVSDGTHTFQVRAVSQGYPDPSPASTEFTVDATPPETTITSGPSGTIYNQTSATFTFTSNRADATFECRLDSAAFAPCTSPHTVSGYSQGTHTFQVRAVSPTGVRDPTPASRTFTYRHCNVLRTIIDLAGNPIVICL